MKGRGLILAIAVLILLGFLVRKELQEDREEGKLVAGAPVFSHSVYDLEAFTLELPRRGVAASLERGAEGAWEVVSGPTGCDATFATDVISAWSRVRFVDIVDEAPTEEDAARYGLDEPLVRISGQLRTADGDAGADEATPSLELGEPSPINAAFYARVGGFGRVVFVTVDALDLESGSGRDLLGLPRDPPADSAQRR